MGIKEKLFENMMGKMSAEEKNRMMQGMMDNFFENMSAEEKKEMMNNMMPKMMSGMTEGKGFSMMDMMKNMMGGKSESMEKTDSSMGFNPMDMCRKMMGNMEKTNDLATYATPEVRALFEEWAEQIEQEILDYIKENKNTNPDALAEKFKISKDSVNFFITKLSQKGKIDLSAQAK